MTYVENFIEKVLKTQRESSVYKENSVFLLLLSLNKSRTLF
jgi:hypothetical protein